VARRQWRVLVGALVGALVLATLGGSLVTAQDSAGGRITIVQGPEPVSLDPAQDINKTSLNIQLAIFDPLVKVTPDGELAPWIATEWTNVEPRVWRFTIREGITFHNGEALTAENVAFSINAYNTSPGEGATYFQFVESATATNPTTVEVVTKTPTPFTPTAMGFLMLLPREYYAEVGPEGFGVEPVGTGPMTFEEWQQGVQIRLARNESYWNGPIALSEVTYTPAPEASTRVAMLETGEADIIANVPPEMIDRVEAADAARIARTPSLRKIFLEFNMKEKPFDDVRVRQAVNLAIDKDALIEFVLGGNAVREIGPVPDGWLGDTPDDQLTRYDYDPDRARQLLAEAGYGDGLTIDFWYPIGRYLKDKEVAEAIAGQLEEVGITSNLQGSDIGTLVEQIHTQTLSGLHFFSWAPLIMDTDNLWRAHFWTEGLNQYAGDARTDELLLAGAAELDPAQRNRIYSELEQYVVNESVPWAFLYRQSLIYGVNDRVQWEPRADEVIDVRTITLAA
jgi:peptide/nickel transport system substrate-binding protein